jgi:hypothetical protein
MLVVFVAVVVSCVSCRDWFAEVDAPVGRVIVPVMFVIEESLETVTRGMPAPEFPVPVTTLDPPNWLMFVTQGEVICTTDTESVPLASVHVLPTDHVSP